ncbi:Ig-like domain-containing protein [Undibacterium sp. Xuan67W]|uniref:Ig-like domain-containing protein n=1 Tax=Undibacterium sp. Xuan67W TaxID=3413057 RepID=UPI003BEFB003
MNQISKESSVSNFFRLIISFMLVSLLSACGGGGGSAGTSSGSNASQYPNGRVDLSLVDSNGIASNLISGSSVLTVKAIVKGSTGAPVVGAIVTFTLDSTIAIISPTTGTALTDANGIAQVSLKSGVGTGAGTVTATTTIVGTTAISSKANFMVGSPPDAVASAINFVSAVPANNSIVIKGAGGNGRTEVALLTFKVVDSSNVGIPNKTVNFSTQSTETVNLVAISGTTDATGQVTAAVSSGTKPTTLRVVATVNGTAISALSDTVTVTTGLPTQTSFTVLREKVNIEGFDFGNIQNKITVLLADANGGVVANGTQVVFTTDSGAIIGDGGVADNARCLTINGACSVVWRSQSPNRSVVTVTATATDGANTIAGSTQFTNSASNGITITNLPGSVTFSKASCKDQSFVVVVTDRNGYTAPNGTTLTVQDATNVTAKIFPATVVAPADVALGGTPHTITLTPANACASNDGHVYVQVATPLGVTRNFPVDVTYTP